MLNFELDRLIIFPAFASFLVCLLTTPIIIHAAYALHIVDYPGKRDDPAILHTKPTPRGGGIPLFLAILVSALLFLPLDQRLAGILIGGALVVGIGFLDDRKNASPYLRLLGQFLAAGVVVASGVGISFVSNPFGGVIDLSTPRLAFAAFGQMHEIWLLSAGFGLIWIVALMNAVSWSSGVDGQLSGFAAIAASVLAIFSLSFSADITQWPVAILASATFGAFLGFLPWHMYPQKIMPGFGGATLAGFMLAVLSILTTTKVGILLVVLAIPLADAGYTIIRRVLSGKSPFWGDKKHLHHKLISAGWSKKKVAFFYWLATAGLGILALYLNNSIFKFYTIIGVALFVGAVLLTIERIYKEVKS